MLLTQLDIASLDMLQMQLGMASLDMFAMQTRIKKRVFVRKHAFLLRYVYIFCDLMKE